MVVARTAVPRPTVVHTGVKTAGKGRRGGRIDRPYWVQYCCARTHLVPLVSRRRDSKAAAAVATALRNLKTMTQTMALATMAPRLRRRE